MNPIHSSYHHWELSTEKIKIIYTFIISWSTIVYRVNLYRNLNDENYLGRETEQGHGIHDGLILDLKWSYSHAWHRFLIIQVSGLKKIQSINQSTTQIWFILYIRNWKIKNLAKSYQLSTFNMHIVHWNKNVTRVSYIIRENRGAVLSILCGDAVVAMSHCEFCSAALPIIDPTLLMAFPCRAYSPQATSDSFITTKLDTRLSLKTNHSC